MTGTYDGIEFFDDFPHCGRVVLRYLYATGTQVDEVKGPKFCPRDNGFYHDAQTLAAAPSAQAAGVEVAMQSKVGGTWGDVNSQRVSIAE